jgi:hypothetical protein
MSQKTGSVLRFWSNWRKGRELTGGPRSVGRSMHEALRRMTGGSRSESRGLGVRPFLRPSLVKCPPYAPGAHLYEDSDARGWSKQPVASTPQMRMPLEALTKSTRHECKEIE